MIKRSRGDDCLSDLRLDAFSVGEASASSSEKAHLDACPLCRDRLASFARDKAAFAEPFPTIRRANRTRWIGAASALALAAALLLFLRPRDEGTRLKGSSAHVGFFVEHEGQVRRGAPGEHVAPGDKLQFVVATRIPAHVVVVSIDGAGATNVYYSSNTKMEPTTGNVEAPLPSSIVLDAVLGPETLWGLVCETPQGEDALKRQLLAEGERFKAPAGCTETRWTIEKR